MNLSHVSLKSRVVACIPTTLTFILLLTGCGNQVGATGGPVSYTRGTGQVLIRLINAPGNIFPSMRALPQWELYGDGTLLYQESAGSDTLMQADLAPDEVTHILDVVVNQDGFFSDKKSLYGKLMADVGEQNLTINANKQQKTVSLFAEEGAPSEDQHMFSILHFLLSYPPPSPHPYAAPGAIVLVRPYPGATAHVVQWPYSDISLQQIAVQECRTFFPNGQGSCVATGGPVGYFPIYGKRGTDLLNLLDHQQIWYMSQAGQAYMIQAWPLLPENLVAQADGKRWVQTVGMNGGRWPLLPGAH